MEVIENTLLDNLPEGWELKSSMAQQVEAGVPPNGGEVAIASHPDHDLMLRVAQVDSAIKSGDRWSVAVIFIRDKWSSDKETITIESQKTTNEADVKVYINEMFSHLQKFTSGLESMRRFKKDRIAQGAE